MEKTADIIDGFIVTGIREWPTFKVISRTSSIVASSDSAIMDVRGTMISRMTVSGELNH